MPTHGELCFLGTSTVLPGPGHETASYVLDGTVLIDTGWTSALRLASFGYDPCAVGYLLLTHGHHDHYLGLPHFLFYRRMMHMRGKAVVPLQIVGPAEDIHHLVSLTKAFLQVERFPSCDETVDILPVRPGDRFSLPGYDVTTARAIHPVPGLCYRFNHLASGKSAVVCGDTASNPAIAELASSAQILVHEASAGPKEIAPDNPAGHSGAFDAARCAQAAGVEALYLVHLPEAARQETLSAARTIFGASFLAEDGEKVAIG